MDALDGHAGHADRGEWEVEAAGRGSHPPIDDSAWTGSGALRSTPPFHFHDRRTPLSIANAVITVGSKDAYYQSSRVVRRNTVDLLLTLGAKPLSESGVQILDLFYKQ
jgi:hypothetical protein